MTRILELVKVRNLSRRGQHMKTGNVTINFYSTQNIPHDVSISIIFVGDISFGRCVRKYVDHGYNNYNDTMVKVAGIIRDADIAVGNLESPFVTKAMQKDRFSGRKRYFLHADHRSATALQLVQNTLQIDDNISLPCDSHTDSTFRFAGFDIMSIANNHLNDYGEKPVNFTRNILSNVGIETIGFNFGSYDSPQQPASYRYSSRESTSYLEFTRCYSSYILSHFRTEQALICNVSTIHDLDSVTILGDSMLKRLDVNR
ncbi:Hypothetical predicted protein, partial [Paramuricea clavata]